MSDHVGALEALVRDRNFDFFGVSIVVTRPQKNPASGSGIWGSPLAEETPVGNDLTKREPRQVMAISRSEFPDLERGSIIAATPRNGEGSAVEFQVDGFAMMEGGKTDSDGYHVAILIPRSSVI